MFQLGLADHVRLSFESVQAAYEGHADAAARLARLSAYARIGTLVTSGAAAAVAAMAARGGHAWIIASAVVTAVAFAACAAYVGVNQQPRIYGHRVSAARLWMICEKYRGLLAEMHDGLLDAAGIQERRNVLLQEAVTVFEQAAPDDRYSFEIARRALRGRAGRAPEPAPAPAEHPAGTEHAGPATV